MQFQRLLLLAWFPSAESGIFGFHVRKPLSGFLGDRPEMQKLQEPQSLQIDQEEFKATYKKPRADSRLNATQTDQVTIKKEVYNTTSNVSGLKSLTVEKELDAAKKDIVNEKPAQKPRRKPTSREEKLIESLKGWGGDSAVGCVTHCRYGDEKRHTWQECLNRCIENGPMRSIMESMLPDEHHAAPSMQAEVPSSLQDHLKRHRERSEEL